MRSAAPRGWCGFAASDKDYEATIRFGVATDTYDIGGREISRTDAVPAPEHLVRALQSLAGDACSRPRVLGKEAPEDAHARELARNEHAVALAPAAVRVGRADLVSFSGGRARRPHLLGEVLRAIIRPHARRVDGHGRVPQALRRTGAESSASTTQFRSQSSARRRVSHRR